jgi:1,4-dihydroxy-2-naphthoate octaprenyltransferase
MKKIIFKFIIAILFCIGMYRFDDKLITSLVMFIAFVFIIIHDEMLNDIIDIIKKKNDR